MEERAAQVVEELEKLGVPAKACAASPPAQYSVPARRVSRTCGIQRHRPPPIRLRFLGADHSYCGRSGAEGAQDQREAGRRIPVFCGTGAPGRIRLTSDPSLPEEAVTSTRAANSAQISTPVSVVVLQVSLDVVLEPSGRYNRSLSRRNGERRDQALIFRQAGRPYVQPLV